jgi:fatty-acyl-CoA synthase
MAAIAKRGHALHAFSDLLQSTQPVPQAFGQAPALCFTTSGTTSMPKFVVHNQHSLIVHADSMQQAFHYDQTSRILASAPFCGAFGFSTLTGGLATGCTVVCEPVSDTHSTLEQIRKHQVTHTYANNESLLKLFEAAPSPAAFATCKLFGFASFSPAITNLLEEAERNHVALTGLYGSSELQALMAAQPLDPSQGDVSVRYLSGGRLIHPDARVRVRDPAGHGDGRGDGRSQVQSHPDKRGTAERDRLRLVHDQPETASADVREPRGDGGPHSAATTLVGFSSGQHSTCGSERVLVATR